MSHFINARETAVPEAIEGLVAASGGALTRLDGFPFIRVVLRSDWDRSRVAVISGGGSGHEPAHAGFVGRGMLTAAVCGDIFASPSVDAVLAAILAATGPAGCLLIVKNYTGDRLNFGLAAERARAFGLRVEMVIVQDDVSLPGISRPRGVAGTLLVHKIAGAVAENGGDLDAVTAAAQRSAARAASVGLSLKSCTIPGSPGDSRIPPGDIEFGLGIHGEPGAERLAFTGVAAAMARAADALAATIGAGPHVALLNNLGATTGLEMAVLARALLTSSLGPRLSHIIGPAPTMTALDMHGFSLTLYPAGDDDLPLLQAPVAVPGWPGLHRFAAPAPVSLPAGLQPVDPVPSACPAHAALVRRVCHALIGAEAALNALDARSGDGDTGSTLATAARSLLDRLDALPQADLTQLFRAIARELSQTMGGSSGVLLAIFFEASGDALSRGKSLAAGLRAGLDRLQQVGGARPGDRTMVDALRPALEALHAGLPEAAHAARKGADLTATMAKAMAGRATYVSEAHLVGHLDPGAEAVARVFECLVDAGGE
jgi:dihydroxyacetone kinase